MNSAKNKIKNFLNSQTGSYVPDSVPGLNENEEIMLPKDGLYERREIINKRMVTKEGKQLLREQLYDA